MIEGWSYTLKGIAEEARTELQREVEMLKRELHVTQAQLEDTKAESPRDSRSPVSEAGPFRRLFCCFKSNQADPYPEHPAVDHQRLVDADDDEEDFRPSAGRSPGRE